VERAINDSVNVVKAITRNACLVPRARAIEMQLIKQITSLADKTFSLSQYLICKFGKAFKVILRTLAKSASLNATKVLLRLYTAYAAQKGRSKDE
jgi:T-complex protein 1 subunit theta